MLSEVDTEGNMNCNYWNWPIEKRRRLESNIGESDHLLELKYELSRIRVKPAYDNAKFLWPKSVTDPIFCLKFLRAADFNPREAARMLIDSLPSLGHGSGKGELVNLADLMLWLQKRKEELRSIPPMDDGTGGMPGLADLMAWFDERNEGIASTSLAFNVDFPSSNDILLGSGFAYQNFPGNQYFITVIELHEGSYNDAGSDQMKKTAISKQVLKMLQQSGVRFLQRAVNEEDGWVQVDDQAARQKVSHAFRNLRRRRGTCTRATPVYAP
jgi:hypothetical protein